MLSLNSPMNYPNCFVCALDSFGRFSTYVSPPLRLLGRVTTTMRISFFDSPAPGAARRFVMLSTTCHADIHRWTDRAAELHLSDKPHSGVESTAVEVHINTYETPSIEGLAATRYPRAAPLARSSDWLES